MAELRTRLRPMLQSLNRRQIAPANWAFHFNLHPRNQALPMEDVVARSEHVAIAVADINIIVANNTIQRLSCCRVLTHGWDNNVVCS